MNKLFLLLCLFCLPLAVSAQTSFTIIENGEEQTVEECVLMSADGIEYISTPLKHYQITKKNMALLGDVNKDGAIDVYDVTLIIEFYLDGTFSFLADVDEDGKTDIYDITAAIEICLLERSPKSIVRSYDVTDVTDIWIKGGQDDGMVEQN